MSYRVLLVEDEPKIASLLIDYFHAADMTIDHVDRGDIAVEVFLHNAYDLLLLDVNLPAKSGYEICAEVRQHSTVPIMMLSALSDEDARLKGLHYGADDYVCKPFSPREVIAKSQALLRRSRGLWAQQTIAPTAKYLQIDHGSYRVLCGDSAAELTKIEFAMLAMLVQKPGRIYSRSQLMSNMYADFRVVSDRTIDSHIKKLRKKLKAMLPDDDAIESIYGVGYRYIGPTPTQLRDGD